MTFNNNYNNNTFYLYSAFQGTQSGTNKTKNKGINEKYTVDKEIEMLMWLDLELIGLITKMVLRSLLKVSREVSLLIPAGRVVTQKALSPRVCSLVESWCLPDERSVRDRL